MPEQKTILVYKTPFLRKATRRLIHTKYKKLIILNLTKSGRLKPFKRQSVI